MLILTGQYVEGFGLYDPVFIAASCCRGRRRVRFRRADKGADEFVAESLRWCSMRIAIAVLRTLEAEMKQPVAGL